MAINLFDSARGMGVVGAKVVDGHITILTLSIIVIYNLSN